MNSEVTKKSVPVLYGSIKRVPQVDNTLTKEGCYADAKAVGDILRGEQRAVNFSYDAKGNGLNANTIQEALDELNENIKEADVNIETLLKATEVYEASGYMANHWSGANNYMVVGKICILRFDIQNGLSPAPANAVFVTDLPKPKASVNFNAWEVDNDYAFGLMPCGITANGELCILKQLTYQHRFAGTVAYQIA